MDMKPAAERSTEEGTILVRVRGLLPDLPPAEQRVAEAVLANPGVAAGQTISVLAQACQTSETTVIRFCRQLGLSGYPSLRLALAAEGGREAGRADETRLAGSDIGVEDSLGEVISKITANETQAIQETGAHLDVATVGKVVDAIVNARRIDIYGVGASGAVAADLQQKLHRIGRVAFAWQEGHAALCSAAILWQGDVAIGISHTGKTIDTVEALTAAGRRGAATVAVTNFPRSPIARAADLVLLTAARETSFRAGAMASRLAQLMVVDCVFVAVTQRTYPVTREALQRTHEAVSSRRYPGRTDA